MFERLELLIGQNIEKLQKAHILIIGIGGVGGYTLECLIRSSILNITVIDPDTFEITNLNRQILSTRTVLNLPKVTIAQKRAQEINPNCHIKPIKAALKEDNLPQYLSAIKYDYIIDTCDDSQTKIALIKYAKDNHLSLISCLGTANKMNPTSFKITKIGQTYNDPLAKKIRTSLPRKYQNATVVWSSELPKQKDALGSLCSIPMSAGALIASYVIQELLK